MFLELKFDGSSRSLSPMTARIAFPLANGLLVDSLAAIRDRWASEHGRRFRARVEFSPEEWSQWLSSREYIDHFAKLVVSRGGGALNNLSDLLCEYLRCDEISFHGPP